MPTGHSSSKPTHNAKARHPWRQPSGSWARIQRASLAEYQHSRLLQAASAVACEGPGSATITVSAVVARARVSRNTFYDVFAGIDDCVLTVIEQALADLAAVAASAYEAPGSWSSRLRAVMVALLAIVERQPVGRLVVSYLHGIGPDAPRPRQRALADMRALLDQGRSQPRALSTIGPLTAEALVGAVISVVHARVARRPAELMPLVGPLMWMIVLPYLGSAAAARELTRPVPESAAARAPTSDGPPSRPPIRLTYRTARVLSGLAETPGASNAAIGAIAGVTDPGQISRLLARLQHQGLLVNTGQGQQLGAANAWRLTRSGRELESTIRRTSTVGPLR